MQKPDTTLDPHALRHNLFSSISHLVGALAAGLGLAPLLRLAAGRAPLLFVGKVYVASVVLAFGASAIYHWFDREDEGNGLLRRIDHAAIFVLIAGTYTPVAFVFLDGGWRWSVLGVQWGVAILGMALKLVRADLPRAFTVGLYLAMGWFALVPLRPLLHTMPASAFVLMLAGGVAYTIGALIYAVRRPSPLPGLVDFHGLFHLFTLAGAGLHYALVYVTLSAAA